MESHLSEQGLGTGLLALSALLHALWNSWVKRETNKETFLTAVIVVACAWSWLGVLSLARPNPFGGLGWSVAAGVFEGLYLVSLTRTLSLAPLAWAYAIMRGGAMALVWLLSAVILGERTGAFGIFGALLIFGGLWLPVLVKGSISSGGIRAALLSASFIAGYHYCYDQALELGAEPYRLFAISLSVSLLILVINLTRLRFLLHLTRTLRVQRSSVFIASVVVYWSFVLFLMGLETKGAGFAITLRNTSIFYALVLAHWGGERINRFQIWSCVLIFSGAIFLALSH